MADVMDAPTPARAVPARSWRLGPSTRRAVLVAHIVVSVGLLGDSAGYLAVAIRAATTSDEALADASYRTLELFAMAFGIPLSFAALFTGSLLGVGTRWGVLRYPWVIAKLVLILSVIAVGGLVLRVGMDRMIGGSGGGDALLIGGAAYDVVALTAATALSVFKPGRPLRPARRRPGAGAQPDPSRSKRGAGER